MRDQAARRDRAALKVALRMKKVLNWEEKERISDHLTIR